MGRPKLYANNAEKQAAYRAGKAAETVPVNRTYHEWLSGKLFALQAAVERAAVAGDAIAATVDTISADDVILSLITHFEAQAVALETVAIPVNLAAVVVPFGAAAPVAPDRVFEIGSVGFPAPEKSQKLQKNRPRR